MKETNAGSQYSRETMEAMQDSGTGIVVATMMHCANVQIAAAPQEGADALCAACLGVNSCTRTARTQSNV